MRDDFDNMLDLLTKTPKVSPDKERKETAIHAALEQFDKKNAPSHQGFSFGRRLMDTVHAIHETIFGVQTMKKSYLVASSLCLGVLAISLLNNADFNAKLAETNVAVLDEKVGDYVSPSTSQTNNAPTVKEDIDISTRAAPAQTSKDDLGAILKSVKHEKPKMKIEASRMAAGTPAAPASMALPSADSAVMGSNIGIPAMPIEVQQNYYHDEGRDKFEDVKPNPIKLAKEEPVSTFSVDVDTSSYSFMRASLNNNVLPQKDAVRIEEMVNYFPYDYEAPKDKETPFKSNVSVFPTPWNKDTKLVHVGIKGYQIQQQEKPHSNLVFLIDTSGSMNEPNRLPLLISSLKLLLETLKEDDTVAIVTYAGGAGTVLEPTAAKEKQKITSALDNLSAGGSTAGAEGIRQAYQLAENHFDPHGINRVILATDGDFNVGITDQNELKSFIERKRNTGIFLSVLGFGMGNYNDALMQTLAQNGNGNAAYIDNLNEARKALVEEAGSTLFPIAKDVKIQVEFNPAQVAEYRLIGYETRMLNREDFNNDKVDAGDIGAGHTVTALYEITPTNSKAKLVDDLRYSKTEAKPEVKTPTDEYAFVKIRYKLPNSDTSKLITTPVDAKVERKDFSAVPQEARFATSVAAFAQLIRGDTYSKDFGYDEVIALAEASKGKDDFGYRAEFINLVRIAKNAAGLKTLQGGNQGGVIPPQPCGPTKNCLY